MRIQFFLSRPETWASTLWPPSNSTVKVVFGRAATTVPSRVMTASFCKQFLRTSPNYQNSRECPGITEKTKTSGGGAGAGPGVGLAVQGLRVEAHVLDLFPPRLRLLLGVVLLHPGLPGLPLGGVPTREGDAIEASIGNAARTRSI